MNIFRRIQAFSVLGQDGFQLKRLDTNKNDSTKWLLGVCISETQCYGQISGDVLPTLHPGTLIAYSQAFVGRPLSAVAQIPPNRFHTAYLLKPGFLFGNPELAAKPIIVPSGNDRGGVFVVKASLLNIFSAQIFGGEEIEPTSAQYYQRS